MEIIKKFCERRDSRGALTFIEEGHDIPFSIKRIYYIYNTNLNVRRGGHAHKSLKQYLVCISGCCKVLLEDISGRKIIELKKPNEGLYVENMVWHEMYDSREGTVLLAIASDYYDENDYIRRYEDFQNIIKNDKGMKTIGKI